MWCDKSGLTIIAFLILISCTLIASADQTNDSGKYTFTNYGGEVYTPEPMEFGANINGTENITFENGTESKHVFLQFYDNATEEQVLLLEEYEVHFIDVVAYAYYTYIVSIPADYTAADLPHESRLRWMGEIPAENKYDMYRGLNVPEWARAGNGDVKLAIHFYDDIPSQKSANIMEKYSDNFSTTSISRPWYYEALTNETSITLIASEDAVRLIGYGGTKNETTYSDFVDNDMHTEQEEKQTPGFTATIPTMVFALIAIFSKRKN
jgi:hypothetical protein